MIWQLILNSLITCSVFALIGVSFSLIYQAARFFHFAHAIVFTSGAYFTFLLKNWLSLPISLAISFSVVCCILLGCLIDVLVSKPLRQRNASPLVLLLASLGIYVVLQNTISLIFGDDVITIRSGVAREGVKIFDARITPVQIVTIGVSILLVVSTAIFLQKTKIGKAMRAVANDVELANISGVDGDRVFIWTFAIGSASAGVAGILVALDVDMTPTMGMNALMMGVVSVIIGGVGSIQGVAFGALLLSFAQHLGIWKISSQWQDAIAFALLLFFLLFRPQGFLGKKVKKATV